MNAHRNYISAIKTRIQPWKIAVMVSLIPVAFFLFACHDRLANEIAQSTLTRTDHYPDVVKADMEEYLKQHPDAKLTYMEGTEAEVDRKTASEQADTFVFKTYNLSAEGVDRKGVLQSNLAPHAYDLQTGDKIFFIVGEAASFEGGYPAFLDYLKKNVRYAAHVRKAGIQGTVYIQFVVNVDGLITDPMVLRRVHPDLDAEALRVVNAMPPWKPGRQNGVPVMQRYVLPIAFHANQQQDDFENADL